MIFVSLAILDSSCMSVLCVYRTSNSVSDDMLPFVAGATQQFHALPACVEDQNIEIGLELANDGFQVDNLGDIGQQQDLQELFLAPELQELFSKISDSEIHFCVDPELVLENAKMPSSCQAQRNNISPAIPLSVQQAQMDNIDQQTISQPDWIQDAVQFSQQQQQQQLPGSDDDAPTSHPQLSVDRLAMQACRETTDQTVPFRRHDSLCSVLSSYSDIKRERCSISEAESTTPSSPFLPTTVSQTSDHHGGRRGRPCVDDVSVLLVPTKIIHRP